MKVKHSEDEEASGDRSESENSSQHSEITSESGYESEATIESEGSEDRSDESDEEMSPWDVIINKTFQLYQPEYEEKVNELMEEGCNDEIARQTAYQLMYETYREQIGKHYLGLISWQQDIKRDPVHRKIATTVRRLRDEEEYEPQEAWKYAVDKRKYLLDNVLDRYDPPPTEDSNDYIKK